MPLFSPRFLTRIFFLFSRRFFLLNLCRKRRIREKKSLLYFNINVRMHTMFAFKLMMNEKKDIACVEI